MRLKLVCCEVFSREIGVAVSRSPHRVDMEFLPQGLHGLGAPRMLARLQEAVDRAGRDACDAVLLGYGLCGNGLRGLKAPAAPLVVPRAHDCITLFLGSKERYREYFDANPGVYFRTTGWLERADGGERPGAEPGEGLGPDRGYAELVARYGEEDAREIMDTLSGRAAGYGQITFIEMGVERDGRFERRAREEAAAKGWKFAKVGGDMALIDALVSGEWDEERFLEVPAGWTIEVAYDRGVLKAVPPKVGSQAP